MNTYQATPLVSAIIAVRNGENFLADAIRSVQAQDYFPVELMVVDGHSTDQTKAIAKSFDGVRWLAQPGSGWPDAWNFGVTQARGDWIALLEHDDIWLPDKLRAQISFMRQQPELQYTLTSTELFLEPGSPRPPGFRPELLEKPQIGAFLSSFVARKEVFTTVGPFNGQWRTSADMDWFARAKDQAVPMAYLPQTLVRKRIHGANLMTHTDLVHAELLQVMREKLKRKGELSEAARD